MLFALVPKSRLNLCKHLEHTKLYLQCVLLASNWAYQVVEHLIYYYQNNRLQGIFFGLKSEIRGSFQVT